MQSVCDLPAVEEAFDNDTYGLCMLTAITLVMHARSMSSCKLHGIPECEM